MLTRTLQFVTAASLLCASIGVAQIQFTDATAVAGLGVEYFESDSKHSLGVVWIDIDNDELPDVFVTNGAGFSGPHMYRNLGGGQFAIDDDLLPALADIEYVGAKAADYDNDGDTDLYVYTAHEYFSVMGLDNPDDGPANLLLKNLFVENGNQLGDPNFVDVAVAAGVDDCPTPRLPGDYGCYQTRTAAFFDYDLDGCVDLFVGHLVMNEPGTIQNRDALYRNNCNGTFSDVTDASGIQPTSLSWRSTLVAIAAHLDQNRCPDLYLGSVGNNANVQVKAHDDIILSNQCDGTFIEILPHHGDDSPAAMGIDISDINRDGYFDIYITDLYDHPHITHDVGNTLYLMGKKDDVTDNLAPVVGLEGGLSWGTNFFDADLDGDEDLFVGLAGGEVYSYLFEDRRQAGYLAHTTDVGLDTFSVRGSALADYDRDGDIDLLIVNNEGPLQLFRNDSVRKGRLLTVRLNQTVSNPDGFGALITVNTHGRVIRRQLKGGTSSHSQDFGEAYFGLPFAVDIIEQVKVEWPNGAVKTYFDVATDLLVVTEPTN